MAEEKKLTIQEQIKLKEKELEKAKLELNDNITKEIEKAEKEWKDKEERLRKQLDNGRRLYDRKLSSITKKERGKITALEEEIKNLKNPEEDKKEKKK